MEFLKIILSWPVVVAGIAITLFLRYGEEIRALMNRFSSAESVELPGVKLGKSQAANNAIEDKEKPQPADVQLPAAPEPTPQPTQVPEGSIVLDQEQWQRVLDMFQSENATSLYWEYSYLNYFLVWKTQRTLDWLAGLGRSANAAELDAQLQSLAPTLLERQAILNALESHHLVSLDGQQISVSPKGRDYIAWRGVTPDLPTPA